MSYCNTSGHDFNTVKILSRSCRQQVEHQFGCGKFEHKPTRNQQADQIA